MKTGEQNYANMSKVFQGAMKEMQSDFQFEIDVNFPDMPEEDLRIPRHRDLVHAASQRSASDNLFVDCSSSEKYLSFGENVTPPIVPTHPYYSTYLKRYLTGEDCLQAQGMWETCWTPEAYEMLFEKKTFAQEIAGNAFSTTVCLATTMVAFMIGPEALNTLPDRRGLKRRLRGKQVNPLFEPALPPPAPTKSVKNGDGNRWYKRKQKGKDSRVNSKGKAKMATIWEKEQLSLVEAKHILQACLLCLYIYLHR